MILLSRLAQCCLIKPFKINKLFSKTCRRQFADSTLEVNTNVTKDVILYKYDNPKQFRIVNIFAYCQFAFWTYLSYFSLTTLKDVPPNPNQDEAWWRRINLGEPKYKNTFGIISFLIGFGCLAVAWTYTVRSVRYLVLNKGGKNLSIVSYTPAGPNRILTVPLQNISCQESRVTTKSSIPLKVKGHKLFYVLDMRGEFRNPNLFDQTAGLRRKFKTTD